MDDILSRLTLDEKISMASSAATISRLGISGVPGGGGGEALHGVSGSPSTVYPVPLGFSQSWDQDLLFTIGENMATEAGVNGSLAAPVTDLMHDPRAGRNYELLGEDQHLVGTLAERMATGESNRTSDNGYFRASPMLKHFLGYNVEVNRLWLNTSMPERSQKEYFNLAFYYPIAAGGSKTFMNSYPLINGKPMSVNPVQGEALREWTPDYPGTGHYEYSDGNDYGSGSSMFVHSQRFFGDTPEGRALGTGESIRNGQSSLGFRDYGSTTQLVYDALARGNVTEADIEDNARRQLALALREGAYDGIEIQDPYLLAYDGTTTRSMLVNDHRVDTLRASQEQVVLLKNDSNTLPLNGSSVTSAVLVGALGEQIGRNNYTAGDTYQVSILDALKNKLGDTNVYWDRALDTVALKASNGQYLKSDPNNVYAGPGSSTAGNNAIAATGGTTTPTLSDTDKLYQFYDYGQMYQLLRAKSNDLALQVPHVLSGGTMAGQLVNNTYLPGQGTNAGGFSYVAYQHMRVIDTDTPGNVGIYNLIAGDGGNNPYGETAMAYDQDDEDTNNGSYLYVDSTAGDVVKADVADGHVGPAINECHTFIASANITNEAPWDDPLTCPSTNRTIDNLPADHEFGWDVVQSSTQAIKAQVDAAPANAPILLVVGYDEWLNAREAIDLMETGLSDQQIRNIEYLTGIDAGGAPGVDPSVGTPLNKDIILIVKTSSPMAIGPEVQANSRVKAIVEIGNSGQEEGPGLLSTMFSDGYSIKTPSNFYPKCSLYTNHGDYNTATNTYASNAYCATGGSFTSYPGYLDANGKIEFEAPAGRLSSTWYTDVTDMVGASEDHPPSSFRYPAYDETLNDQLSNLNGSVPIGLNVNDIVKGGRTHQYLDATAHPPLYPFGYGLTYGSMTYSDLAVSALANGKFTVSGKVTNNGTVKSDEVVEIYSRFAGTPSRIQQPYQKLIAFDRIQDIAPGASASFSFTVDTVTTMAVWDVEAQEYILEPGVYKIMAAHYAGEPVAAGQAVSVDLTVTTSNGGQAAAQRNLGKALTKAESFDDYSNISGDLEDIELVSESAEYYGPTVVQMRANGGWLLFKDVQLSAGGTFSVKLGSDRAATVELHAVASGAPAPALGASSKISSVTISDTRPLSLEWDPGVNTAAGQAIGPIAVRNETTFGTRQYPNSPKGLAQTNSGKFFANQVPSNVTSTNAYVEPVMEVKSAATTATAGTYDVYLLTSDRGVRYEWLKVSAAADTTTSISEIYNPVEEYSIREANGKIDLDARLVPETSTSAVTWSSSNPSIATVDANGIVAATGTANGTVTITATSNGQSKSLDVLVTNQLTSNKVTIGGVARTVGYPWLAQAGTTSQAITAKQGTTQVTMLATGLFSEEANGFYLPGTTLTVPPTSVDWTVVDEGSTTSYLATINANGVVTASGMADGNVVVTGTLQSNPDISASRTILISGQKTGTNAYTWVQAESYETTDSQGPACIGMSFWGMCFGTWAMGPATATSTYAAGGNEVGSAMTYSANSMTSYGNIDFRDYEQEDLGIRISAYPGWVESPSWFGNPPGWVPMVIPDSLGQPYHIEIWADAPSASVGGIKIADVTGTLGTEANVYETVVTPALASLSGIHEIFVKTDTAVNVNWLQWTTKDSVLDRLNEDIAEAENWSQGNTPPGVWADFQAALAAAKAIAAQTPAASQAAIDKAAFELEGLLDSVGATSVSTAGLNQLLGVVNSLDQADYTPASWATLQSAVSAAQALLAPNAKPNAASIATAVAGLSSAVAGLQPIVLSTYVPATPAETLTKVIAELKNKLTDPTLYTDDSWANYAKALDAASTVANNPAATQAEADKVYASLFSAVANLVPKAASPATPVDPDAGKVNLSTSTVKAGWRAYTGKQVKPGSIYVNGKKLVEGTDFTYTSLGTNKAIGKGTATITGIGNNTGTKSVTFKIVPKKSKITKLAVGSKKLTVTWKKSSSTEAVTGYEVAYKVKGAASFKTKTVKGASKVSLALTGLTKGKQYVIKVRAYKTISGVKYPGPWTQKTSLKVK
ncbi:MAG: glycoside hydrolase family 3 C-terminal domain-containing protein [Propionibacteriaceae bacterium]|nr:glycoside hydrolase family 3 C-terminal domain-containing protein [Propionibacteriaceae bacterium]